MSAPPFIPPTPAASAKKAELEAFKNSVPLPANPRNDYLATATDPTNMLIIKIRDEKCYKWQRIADLLNESEGLVSHGHAEDSGLAPFTDADTNEASNMRCQASKEPVSGQATDGRAIEFASTNEPTGATGATGPMLFDINSWDNPQAVGHVTHQPVAEDERDESTAGEDSIMRGGNVFQRPAEESLFLSTDEAGPSVIDQASAHNTAMTSTADQPDDAITEVVSYAPEDTGMGVPVNPRLHSSREIYSRWLKTKHAIAYLDNQCAKEQAQRERLEKIMKSHHAKRRSAEWDSEWDVKLVDTVHDVGKDFWSTVSERLRHQGKLRTGEQCEERFKKL